MTTLASYFLSYFPLIVSDAISCPLCDLNTLRNIIMIYHSYIEQVMTMCRVQEWQLLLSYFFSYFLLIVSDKISCPLCNLNTLWNIIMILHSYVEQVMTMCCVQEWQLLLAYRRDYFMKLYCFVEEVVTMCSVWKNTAALMVILSYPPPPPKKKKNPGFGFFVKIHLLERSKLEL